MYPDWVKEKKMIQHSECEKCESMRIELSINSETIAKISQDNRMMREYITKLEKQLEIKAGG